MFEEAHYQFFMVCNYKALNVFVFFCKRHYLTKLMSKFCFNRSRQNKIYLLTLFTKEALNITITHWKTFDIHVNDNDINFLLI